MTKRANSKYKLDRRVGENLWGRPKSPVNKRSYGPGQHGQRRAKKLSDYGTQLQAKQKLKAITATSPSGSSANIIRTPRAAPATPART
jgi:small subunit ribosomal protein S4